MDAGSDAYTRVRSDPFDGTTMPISYIPNWTKTEYQNKALRFEEIPISDYIATPLYDALSLANTQINTKTSQIIHYTYITPYMGSYRLNYKENDGSHLGVDIRAPIGTPVLSIANWVIIRTTEADATGNKFVVIRHDNVPYNGKNTTLYSGYLHLSQINVTEWTKVRKWDMIGRVGMTGIATTPHLHIQIDTPDAPFHPYWPFNYSDSSKAGFSFYQSVNAGLGRESAEKYSIHPMSFINTFLGGIESVKVTAPPQINQSIWGTIIEDTAGQDERKALLGSEYSQQIITCQKNRFSDVWENSPLGKLLYPLVDSKCLFQEDGQFESKKTLTKWEALILIMSYYNIQPVSGTSHFLDIPIGDILQWYALIAYRRWILDGNYAEPNKIITKEDFAELIVKVSWTGPNPSQIRIYNDVDSMNLRFSAIQSFGFMTKARGGKFSPKSILTRGIAAQMLGNIHQQTK